MAVRNSLGINRGDAEARARAAIGLSNSNGSGFFFKALPWVLAVGGLLYGTLNGNTDFLRGSAAGTYAIGTVSTGHGGYGAACAPGQPGCALAGVAIDKQVVPAAHRTDDSHATGVALPTLQLPPKKVTTIIIIEDDDESNKSPDKGSQNSGELNKTGNTSIPTQIQQSTGKQPAAGSTPPTVAATPVVVTADDIPQFPAQEPVLKCKSCFRFGSGIGERRCLPAVCPVFPATGRNVISTSLYGGDRRYTGGAIRNAELAPIVFPGWQLRFYVKNDVPVDVLDEMRSLGTDIVVLTDNDVGFGMNWRFLVADDETVDAFVCRDADSRLSLRDRYAVEEWVQGSKPFHVVRDHPSHASLQLMGGTWGSRRSVFQRIGSLKSLLSGYVSRTGDSADYGSDINFLQKVMWPKMLNEGLAQHDSYSCQVGRHGPAGLPFPRPRAGVEHVGGVYLWDGQGHEIPRQGDLDILIRDREPAACAPSTTVSGENRKELSFSQLAAAGPSVAWGQLSGCKGKCSTSWSQKEGVCTAKAATGSSCKPSLVHWQDAFIDHAKSNQNVPYTAVFDYDNHVIVGAPRSHSVGVKDGMIIPQYHERMPYEKEPIQALDGGVRYYSSLAILSSTYGENALQPTDTAAVAALALHDLPRILQAVHADSIFLLPSGLASAVDNVLLAAGGDGRIPAAQATTLRQHIVSQEGPPTLYYGRDVYVHACSCS